MLQKTSFETIQLDKIQFRICFSNRNEIQSLEIWFKIVEVPVIFTDRTEGFEW